MMATMTSASSKSAFLTGQGVQKPRASVARAVTLRAAVAQAQDSKVETSRRAVLSGVAGAAALFGLVESSQAAYGDAANVFGRASNTSGFVPYSGEGFALLLPAKWNPSKEREFPGIQVRYEDNGDAVNSLLVIAEPTTKGKIEDFGGPDKFLQDFGYLLGEQVFTGATRSEGGFKENRVSAASVLDVSQATDKKGKSYYKFDILTRTADGDEGGRHQLINATVSGGKLYILKVQVGDKRWFKGADKFAQGVVDSFVVA